ncbi:MAG TPA: asparaginase [Chloroflexota bacterium]
MGLLSTEHAASGPPVPLVGFTRGTILESVHYGSIAVVDAGGKLVVAAGDVERITTLRSAAKPFQAMAVVESGAADRFNATEAELAIMAGSHSGEPRHVESVLKMLARADLAPEDLQCGTQLPLHEPTRKALVATGLEPSPLHHNCSGKHCGMLWACVYRGWDVRTYRRPDHPLQRAIQGLMADMAGSPVDRIVVAIDGCGVPAFGMPLRAMGTAFARLASGIPSEHRESANRIVAAMVAHPEMVGGEGRLDTDLMRQGAGRILAKAGAEACHGAALLDRGLGIALKIEDGGARAAPLALIETLRQLDALADADLESLSSYARPAVRNYRGEIVGEGKPLFTLER